MARSKDSSSVFSQDRPVRYVALYARVSTLHGQQDPEMQLFRIEGVCDPTGLEHLSRIRRSGCFRIKRVSSGSQSPHV
jgi:DNA invertase Pin-like site-specific DNA recombinase